MTGASQGIGRAVAIRLAQEGATVAINYSIIPRRPRRRSRSRGPDRPTAATASSDHLIVQADVGNEQEVAAMFETCLARWKRLDCLVNNAGFQRESPSEALDIDTYRRIIDVN